MRIVEQITNIIPKWFHSFIQDRGAYKHKDARFVSLHINFCFLKKKYLRQPSIDFEFCYLSSIGE